MAYRAISVRFGAAFARAPEEAETAAIGDTGGGLEAHRIRPASGFDAKV